MTTIATDLESELACEQCDEEMTKPAITVHRGSAPDLKFCSTACHADWDFERAMESFRRKTSIEPDV